MNMYSKAIQRLWTGRCDIINYSEEEDENGITASTKKVIAQDVPCRVSYESDKPAVQSTTTDNTEQQIKLFIAADIDIKAGSEITVTQNGTTRSYVSAGVPNVYSTHQEVMLVIAEEYA